MNPPSPSRPAQRSFLLRLSLAPGRRSVLLQDLRSGERLQFDDQAALQRFLAEQRQPWQPRAGDDGNTSGSNPPPEDKP